MQNTSHAKDANPTNQTKYPTNPMNYPTHQSNYPTGAIELDILNNPTIQQAASHIQQSQRHTVVLDITPDKEEDHDIMEQELTEEELDKIAPSDSKFPVAEYLALLDKIKSVSNMISRESKKGDEARQSKIDIWQEERKVLNGKKEAARAALRKAGVEPPKKEKKRR